MFFIYKSWVAFLQGSFQSIRQRWGHGGCNAFDTTTWYRSYYTISFFLFPLLFPFYLYRSPFFFYFSSSFILLFRLDHFSTSPARDPGQASEKDHIALICFKVQCDIWKHIVLQKFGTYWRTFSWVAFYNSCLHHHHTNHLI